MCQRLQIAEDEQAAKKKADAEQAAEKQTEDEAAAKTQADAEVAAKENGKAELEEEASVSTTEGAHAKVLAAMIPSLPASAIADALGKEPITVKNAPGFVVNRILVPMINEAFFVLSEGLASPEDIDAGMKLGCNHPIGPLALADMIGLDTCLAIMEVYFKNFSDSKYRPCPLLREMVAAGYLGRKTGRGVYKYD